MAQTTTATILFTDVVGSTSLLDRVGEDAAAAVRREHFRVLRKVLEAHGGNEVKNLGDGLMVVFDGVIAGVGCAIAMQQAVATGNKLTETAEPLEIRIGLSSGECDAEDGDYFGQPVVEAARLCASAAPGQILITELARLLVGGRGNVDLLTLGERQLKGLSEPIALFEVVWQPLVVSDDTVLPTRLGSAGPFGFVGREAEKARLSRAWKEVVSGQRRAVFLSGEPGVGKTTLGSEFARVAHEEAALVLYGRCDDELGIPYQPWVEMFAHLDEHLGAELQAAAGVRGGDLGPLVPALRVTASSGSSDPESERLSLFAATAGAFRELSEKRPLLLMLDDLHWADRPTLALLRHLVGGTNAGRLMVLGTFRDSEVDERHPLAELLAAFHRNESVERMLLRGLGDDEIIALLQSAAGHALPAEGVELAHALRRETNGNPFFAIEILRHLAETGVLTRDDAGHWVGNTGLLERGLPVSVREVVGQRVARLGDETTRVLRAASVIGREFDLELLATVVDLNQETALDLIEEALVADLVAEVSPGRFAFVHALVEHTLYESLSSTRRARFHRRVAEAIEELGGAGRIAELAHHWSEATSPQDSAKAVDYARKAGDHALDSLAPDEARRWYARALELLEAGDADPRVNCELLVALGEAQRRAGDAAYRATLFVAADAAAGLEDTELLVRAALANGRHAFSRFGDVDQERLELLRRALDALGDSDQPRRALLLARIATELTYVAEPAERRALADEALELAGSCGDEDTLLTVLLARGDTISSPAWIGERREVGEAALAIAERRDDPIGVFLACEILFDTAWAADDPAAAADMLGRLTEIAGRFDQPELRWPARWREAESAIVCGDLAVADSLTESALEIGLEAGQPDALVFYLAQICVVRFMQGRLGELMDVFEEIVATSKPVPIQDAILAWGRIEVGRRDDAAADVAARRDEMARVPMDEHWTFTMATWARVITEVGDLDAAAVVFELIAPWSHLRSASGVSSTGPLSLYAGGLAGLLGRADTRKFLEQAIDATALAGDAFNECEARLLLARHAGSSDPALARRNLDQAETLAEGRGFSNLDARIAAARQRLEAVLDD